MKIFKFIIICLLLKVNIVKAENISEIAKSNLRLINSLKVEEKWQKGKIVNCKTGETLEQETAQYEESKLKRRTYSSCFIYATAVAFKLPKNSLPTHPEDDKSFVPGLLNKQAVWFETIANKYGWNYIENKDQEDNFTKAQKFANQGYLVIAIYKNTNFKGAGHAAVVIPSDKNLDKIKNEGPDIAQAGNTNFSKGSLKKGFKNKKDAFKNNEIKFYYYKLNV